MVHSTTLWGTVRVTAGSKDVKPANWDWKFVRYSGPASATVHLATPKHYGDKENHAMQIKGANYRLNREQT